MGDGRAEGSSAIGDGGQAAISLTPDVDGTGSGSLLDSIYLLEKAIQRCLGSSSFFLVIDDTVALDCILNGCCNLRVLLYVWVLCLKTNSASSNKENPLAISCVVNLFGSSVTSSSSCLSSSFLWASNSIRSSLVSSSCCAATVLYSKVHKSTATGGCTRVTMYAGHVN